jgi:hypothetical protein
VSILEQALHRRIIEVRGTTINTGYVTVSDLLDKIEEFTKDANPDNEIVLEGSNGIGILELRLETEEEYDRRVAEHKAYVFAEQAKADRSWKRQQARFAKARQK